MTKREKPWKHPHTDRGKAHRAAQIDMACPPASDRRDADDAIHVLFVCSRNRWRSPTAEQVYRGRAGLSVRSAGTSRAAVHPVSAGDVAWADVILVMEDKHKSRLAAAHPDGMRHKAIHVLDIPDDYRYMQPELVAELVAAIDPILFPA